MKVWRMAFRAGNRGPTMWPFCVRFQVAAITYPGVENVDLSRYTPTSLPEPWRDLSPAPKGNLRKVAFEIKKGDVIYAKEGTQIVGEGTVQGPYRYDYDRRIVDPYGWPWTHQVPVAWQNDFAPVTITLGAEQTTVLELSGERLGRLQAAVERSAAEAKGVARLEGETYREDQQFRTRNRSIG